MLSWYIEHLPRTQCVVGVNPWTHSTSVFSSKITNCFGFVYHVHTYSLRLLVYSTVCQIWSISLYARSGLFHCLPDLVYFTVCQIWSISPSARSGLFHCLPDLVYFTVCQIWSISLSARSGLFHCLPDLVYFTVRQIYFNVRFTVCQIYQIW